MDRTEGGSSFVGSSSRSVEATATACKGAFSSKRSVSESSAVKTDGDNEAAEELPAKTATLRRSRSGRVKALTRTRSMVSTFDFETVREQDAKVDGVQSARRDVEEEAGRRKSMLKRIEKRWPGIETDQTLWGEGSGREVGEK